MRGLSPAVFSEEGRCPPPCEEQQARPGPSQTGGASLPPAVRGPGPPLPGHPLSAELADDAQ